ncbi:MAG TPA: hypothetical protein VF939_11495 [Puia sp.]
MPARNSLVVFLLIISASFNKAAPPSEWIRVNQANSPIFSIGDDVYTGAADFLLK